MRLPTSAASAILAASAALASCQYQSNPPPTSTTTTTGSTEMDMCPMRVSFTTATAVDVEGGVALEFKTSSGNTADLRARVRHMGDMHHGGPPSTATFSDVPGGARIVFQPQDPAQLEALRAHVSAEALRMKSGCPPQR
jgi:hypothetical protein